MHAIPEPSNTSKVREHLSTGYVLHHHVEVRVVLLIKSKNPFGRSLITFIVMCSSVWEITHPKYINDGRQQVSCDKVAYQIGSAEP